MVNLTNRICINIKYLNVKILNGRGGNYAPLSPQLSLNLLGYYEVSYRVLVVRVGLVG